MKIYLLVAILILGQTSAFRYLNSQPLLLSPAPQSISYLAPNQIVAQTGNIIQVYNTLTQQVEQTFTSDSNTPNPQINNLYNMVLFKNNNSIFQMQPVTKPLTVYESETFPYWVFPYGLANNTIVTHQLSAVDGSRIITYLNTSSSISQQFQLSINNENLLSGSAVVALSPSEYYFVSGGACLGSSGDNLLYYFAGDENGISNVYNLTIPGCTFVFEQEKKEQGLQIADLGNGNRLHAVTYKLDELNYPRTFTTQLLNQTATGVAEWTRFDVERSIGTGFIGSTLYSADDLLCRLVQHYPQNYDAATTYTSLLTFNVTSTALSSDQSQILVLSNTSTVNLLKVNPDGSFSNKQTFSLQLAQFNKGYFYNNNLWLLLDSNSTQVFALNTSSGSWANSNITVVDFCVTTAPVPVVFILESIIGVYTLTSIELEFIGNTTNFVRGPNANLGNFTKAALYPLDTNTALLYPLSPNSTMSTWQASATNLTSTGSLLRTPGTFDQLSFTLSYILFQNTNGDTAQVYDFRLLKVSITGTNTLFVAPLVFLDLITFKSTNDVFFLLGEDPTHLVSLEHYALVATTLVYQGSFPLTHDGIADINKIVYLPSIGRLSIDYARGTMAHTLSYDITLPPQQIRGHFFDPAYGCNGYFNALFRFNNATAQKELILIGSDSNYPTFQRYTFDDTTVRLLTLANTALLDHYVYTKMEAYFSQDQQNIVIYGIKQTGTDLTDSIHVRNAFNLDTIYEQFFFSETNIAEVQAYGLNNGGNFITTVTNLTAPGKFDLTLSVGATSQGKISTGSASVDIFASCSKCSFLATASSGSSLVQLISLQNGLNRGNISTICPVQQIALRSDGTKLAYLCANNTLSVYDITQEQNIVLTSLFTQITSIYFLGNSALVIISNGHVYQTTLNFSSPTPAPTTYKSLGKVSSLNIDYNAATVAVNNDLQVYAFSPFPQEVYIFNFAGNQVGYFKLDSNEAIVGLTFDQSNNNLIITTNGSTIVSLSPSDCPTNSSLDDVGYCACDPTFAYVDSNCQCTAPLSLVDTTCSCGDGNYYISETQCGQCSAMCKNCDGDSVSNCNGYSALFVIIIVVSILVVIGIGVLIWFKTKKTPSKMSEIHKSAMKSREQSHSEDAIEERLIKEQQQARE